jgi:hypothetical protein
VWDIAELCQGKAEHEENGDQKLQPKKQVRFGQSSSINKTQFKVPTNFCKLLYVNDFVWCGECREKDSFSDDEQDFMIYIYSPIVSKKGNSIECADFALDLFSSSHVKRSQEQNLRASTYWRRGLVR